MLVASRLACYGAGPVASVMSAAALFGNKGAKKVTRVDVPSTPRDIENWASEIVAGSKKLEGCFRRL